MPGIPSLLLRQLYTFGSLKNVQKGVQFSIKNRLSDAKFTGLQTLRIDDQDIPLDVIYLDLGGGEILSPEQVSYR